jgi:hypothetical protein
LRKLLGLQRPVESPFRITGLQPLQLAVRGARTRPRRATKGVGNFN